MSKGTVVTANVNYILENGIKIPKGFPLIKTSKLKRNPKNIKLHSKEQIHDIVELIKMVGFLYPIVIDRNFLIWGGHGRLDSAEFLEMKKVPFVYLDNLSEDQKKVFLIMDNKVNESAWVSENLKIIFDEVPEVNFENFQMSFDNYFQKNIDIAEEEWQNMPEFYQEDQDAYRRIVIKFDNEKDITKFTKLIKEKITNRTKSIWFPHKNQNKTTKEFTDGP